MANSKSSSTIIDKARGILDNMESRKPTHSRMEDHFDPLKWRSRLEREHELSAEHISRLYGEMEEAIATHDTLASYIEVLPPLERK